MPIDITAVNNMIDREDEELKGKIIEIGGRRDVGYEERRDAAMVAIQLATFQRLGDMIKLQLQR